MGFHTFDAEKADRLEDAATRYRALSREELLSALSVDEIDRVADLGSGTGFYTDDVAPFVECVYAVDIQEAMHDAYRQKGIPESVECVTSGIEELPFETGELDAVFSTMTYHEFATPDAIAEIARVLPSGGQAVIVDWAADGDGEAGPPTDERFTATDAVEAFEAGGFEITRAETRRETFLLIASAP
jgi:ubiquinone/menaquinone biosynthesis C-methylase UbiE